MIHVSRHRIDLKVAPLLCQEFVEGRDLEIFVFAIDGVLKAWRICYHEYGPRSFIEDESLLKHCEKLLEALNYDGPGLIDVRYDAEWGVCAFLEINVRFPAPVMYHYLAGLNYVELALRAGLGLDINPCIRHVAEKRVQRSWADVLLFKANEYFIRFARWRQKHPIHVLTDRG